MTEKKILVIGAHSADFVWRAAGTIATITSQGGSALVIALSYGERGESGELWKEPNQTVEKVKRTSHEEAVTAADTALLEPSHIRVTQKSIGVRASEDDGVNFRVAVCSIH